MEIKITCACGQDFKFEVEPVNGVMPCAVNCPACGADDTHLANEFMAHASDPVRLRVNRPTVAAASTPGISESAAPAPSKPQRFYTRSLEPDKPSPPSQENVPMGILGGAGAALIGMAAWYAVSVATGYRFGIVAWVLGLFTGYGVRVLGRDGTPLLGAIAAICASVAILGGEFLEINAVVNGLLRQKSEEAYQKKTESAKAATDAKSDDEVKMWLAKYQPSQNTIGPEEIAKFRDETQTRLKAFLDGTPTEKQFEKDFITRVDSLSLRYKIFNSSMTFFTIIWVCLGIATAYRIGSA